MISESLLRRAGLAAAGASTCVALAAPGQADPAGTGPRVEYDAPAGCPPAEVFGSELRLRLRDAASPQAQWARVVVRIGTEANGYRGTLRLPESSDGRQEREVRSADCGELVKALALIGSVVVLPHRGADKDPVADRTPEEAPAIASRGTEPTQRHSESEPEGPRHPDSPSAAGASPPPVSHHRTEGGLSFVGSAGIGAQTGPAPAVVWGPRVSVGADWSWASSGAAVGARLSATQSSTADVHRTVGDAKLSWQAVRFEGCGSFRAGSLLVVEPCACFEMGRLHAEPTRAAHPITTDASWYALGGVLRARAQVGRFFLYADGVVSAPLERAHFYFARPTAATGLETIHRVPSLAIAAESGVGVHFP